MARKHVAAALQTAGLTSGVIAGFLVCAAVGFAVLCGACVVLGVALERSTNAG